MESIYLIETENTILLKFKGNIYMGYMKSNYLSKNVMVISYTEKPAGGIIRTFMD